MTADRASELPILGGSDAPVGKWPDVAAIMFLGEQGCTGVLIAPTLVLTAGHCADPDLDSVLIGTTSLARPDEGETISVVRQVPYPDSWNTFDAMILELARPSTLAPRIIVSGWARFDLVTGIDAAIVGYGALDRDANQYVDELQEAITTVTDSDCTTSVGCNDGAKPAGELGAGGGGTDTCPGDSGGPLYLLTGYGAFLAGVTSRTYQDAQFACQDGGIYVRADALIPWIEEQTGVALPRGPMPAAEPIVVASGAEGRSTVEPGDPRPGATHQFSVVMKPAYGTAEVAADGVVTYRADGNYVGDDAIEVSVVDTADASRLLRVRVAVKVTEADGGGCGCRTTGDAAGGLPVLLVGLALCVRRRRRA